MPFIKVKKPFRVKFERGKKVTAFGAGVHPLTKEQLANPFVQAMLKDERAVETDKDGRVIGAAPSDTSEASEIKAQLDQAAADLAAEVAAHTETKDKLVIVESELATIKSELKIALAELAKADEPPIEDRLLAIFPKLTADAMKADGTPTVKACADKLGTTVTADQVAAAWAKFKPTE